MRRLTLLFSILPLTMCCVTAGCSGVTLGPRVETRYVIVDAGAPLEVLENKTVRARLLNGTGDAVQQDLGGWVAMPKKHWDRIKAVLEAK